MVEQVDPPFTFGVSELQLQGNQTRSIDVRVEFAALEPGHGAASFADFVGGSDFLFLAIQAAAQNETGITVQDLGNGTVRVTFAANASTNELTFDILAVDDGIDEPIEDFRFVIENEQVTNGAEPGTIIPGPGTSFTDSEILDLDEYQVTISDAVGNEGEQLVFQVTLSNPSDEVITLDLRAQPLTTVDTNPATPGVDFAAGNFEYSVNGGTTWIAATGPNGTIVEIPIGATEILVRIDTFTDGTLEGDESFLLTVANQGDLHACDVTSIVNGAGYIFDSSDRPCGPTYFIKGAPCLVEEVDPSFTFGVSDLMLAAGQTRSIDIKVEFASIEPGHGAASFADFVGGSDFLIDAISAAAAAQTGITVSDLGNGSVRVTFAANASTNELKFDVLAAEDGLDEPVEDFRFVLSNEQVTGGAAAGTIVPGEGTSFVDSKILDPDEYQVTISDATGFEGEKLVFDITLSNAGDEPITLQLAAVPFGTVDTNPAQPGVDLEAANFEVSYDGGQTWEAAGGPNGTSVTFQPGATALQVRIDTFTDGVMEGDESFKLEVANKDEIGHCDVTKIVEGYGYIFDSGDCQTPPPEWFVCGPPCLIEAVDPPYTVGVSELALAAGQTRSVDVKVEFTSFHTGHDAASFADLGGQNFLFRALRDAANEEEGISVQNLGNGAVRVTFASNASTSQLEFDLFPVSDDIDENVEDFRIVLENSTATNGAPVGVIVPGAGTSFVESHIVESDEYMVTIGNAQANEGDPLVFAVNLSNPHTDEPLTLDLAAISGSATAGTDFEAFGFQYSTDGGVTWQAAGGPDGTSVTFAPGQTDLLVRIDSFPDSFDEGRENFKLTVANQDELGPCDLSGVEDGKGIIIDVKDCEPPPCEPPPCEPPPKDCEPPKHHGWTPKQDNHGPRDWSARGTGATHAALAAMIGLPAADALTDHGSNGKHKEWSDDHSDGNGKSNSSNRNTGDDGWSAAGHEIEQRHGDSGEHDDWNQSSRSNWGDDKHDGRNGNDSNGAHGTAHDQGNGEKAFKFMDDWSWSEPDRGNSNQGNHTQAPAGADTKKVVIGGDEGQIHYGTDGSDRLTGTDGDDVIYAGLGDDIVRGGAGNDLIVGGSGADILRGGAGDDTLVAKAGFAEIHGGSGFDTFKFDDSGVLDLSALSGKVTGIEQADITGTGNVELKLTFQDLLTMTDNGHQLTIVGNTGDKVSADFSGHDVAVSDMGAFTRYVIDNGAATLDIDNHVQKNIVGI